MRNQILILLLILPFVAFSKGKEDKLGGASMESLKQTAHPMEADAKAAILLQKITINTEYEKGSNQWVTYTEVFKRIKIYDATESDRGNFVIPFYDFGSSKESVTGIKGVTYNMEGGKMSKTDLDKKSVFDERSSRYYSQMKVAMPNVKEGSVIELKYKVRSPILRIPRRFVQFDIPCDKSEYTVTVPEYFRYNTSSTGTLPIDVSENTGSERISFMSSGGNGRISNQTVSYNTKSKTYISENTPSLKDEDYVPQMDNYRGSIKYELSGYMMPGSTYQNFLKSWDEIAENLGNDSFGKFLNQKKKELQGVTAQWISQEPRQRAESIYNYVKDNYRWNEYYGIESYDGLGDLLKTKKGNIADINLLLVKLLRDAGLTAHPVVSRARNRGFMNMYYPTVDELNYVMAALISDDDKVTLLDASSKILYFGALPPRALNLKGVIITDTDRGLPIDIKNPNKGKTIQLANVTYDAAEGLKVSSKTKKIKYDAIRLLSEKNAFTSEEEWYEHIESANEEKEFENVEVTFAEELKKGATISQEFLDEYSAEEIGNELHIDATFGFGMKSHPFKSDNRSYPIFYNSADSEQITVKFAIPEGYEVQSLPEAMVIGLPEKKGSYEYSTKMMNNDLVVMVRESINTDIITSEMYPALKEFYSQVVKKNNEKIILKKI